MADFGPILGKHEPKLVELGQHRADANPIRARIGQFWPMLDQIRQFRVFSLRRPKVFVRSKTLELPCALRSSSRHTLCLVRVACAGHVAKRQVRVACTPHVSCLCSASALIAWRQVTGRRHTHIPALGLLWTRFLLLEVRVLCASCVQLHRPLGSGAPPERGDVSGVGFREKANAGQNWTNAGKRNAQPHSVEIA